MRVQPREAIADADFGQNILGRLVEQPETVALERVENPGMVFQAHFALVVATVGNDEMRQAVQHIVKRLRGEHLFPVLRVMCPKRGNHRLTQVDDVELVQEMHDIRYLGSVLRDHLGMAQEGGEVHRVQIRQGP